MISVTTVMLLLVVHFVFDFVLQSDRMAKNKSSCNDALSEHVLVYTVGLAIAAMVLAGPTILALTWVWINASLHWVTDYFTSRINKKLWEKGQFHNFFVGVGADQLIHYTCLILTAYFILGV